MVEWKKNIIDFLRVCEQMIYAIVRGFVFLASVGFASQHITIPNWIAMSGLVWAVLPFFKWYYRWTFVER